MGMWVGACVVAQSGRRVWREACRLCRVRDLGKGWRGIRRGAEEAEMAATVGARTVLRWGVTAWKSGTEYVVSLKAVAKMRRFISLRRGFYLWQLDAELWRQALHEGRLSRLKVKSSKHPLA